MSVNRNSLPSPSSAYVALENDCYASSGLTRECCWRARIGSEYADRLKAVEEQSGAEFRRRDAR